jgi:signal transduction histidine kinase
LLGQGVPTNQAVYQKVDSLKRILATATGRQLYVTTFEIGYELFDVDNVEAVKYAATAHDLSYSLGDSTEIARSGRILGQLLRRLNRLDEAVSVFTKVLPIAERNQIVEEQKRILNGLAATHSFRASYDNALFYHFKSLEIREREGNLKEIAVALNNIGFVFYKMGDFEQALDYYQRTLSAKKEVNDNSDLDQTLVNAALCHVYLKNYAKARSFVEQGFAACQGQCSDNLRIIGEFCLGMTEQATGKEIEAKGHYSTSYKLSLKVGDQRHSAETGLNLGTIFSNRGDYDSAKYYLSEAVQRARQYGYSQIVIQAYLRYSDLYTKVGDFENASFYQAKYIHLHDSIYSQELIRNIAKIQTNYAERENIKTIAEQDEILRLNQIVIDRQRQVYFFVALVAILSIMITYVFLRYSRALTKAKVMLSVANQTLERRVEDRTKALQNVNNELDNFIYKTSHDIRGPLASLKGIANVALLELTDTKAQDYLHKLDASADKLNTILTRLLIVNQINHAVLSPVDIEFKDLIQEILTFERKKGIPARLTIRHEVEPDVKLTTDRHILRIILENLIDNAIKYHNSSDRVEPFVNIKVANNHNGVKIDVTDNGIGIKEQDPQKLFQMFVRASERSESGGIGLYLTKLAAERLYAKVDFSTTPENYTQFTVTLPGDLKSVISDKEKELA